MDELIGLGLYAVPEASRLARVPAWKIRRWLKGHTRRGRHYEPLWDPEVPAFDGQIYLSFRDLMEIRIANRLIEEGISAQKVRAAIISARDLFDRERPLSTNRFKTDGRDIFVQLVEEDEQGHERARLLDLLKKQYAIEIILNPLLVDVDFDEGGAPRQWWPLGRTKGVLVDPARSFGQPIDAESSVPTAVLAAAGQVEGVRQAAHLYDVSTRAVRRAMAFEKEDRLAA